MDGRGDMRDLALCADIAEALEHDARFGGLRVNVEVKGGVAHVRGDVASSEQRDQLRWKLSRVSGIYAVWDSLRVAGNGIRIIDVGCGSAKQSDEATGLDRYASAQAELLADLACGLPFRSGSIDVIFAVHVLEHIEDLTRAMRELHRVLRPDGVLHLMVPDNRHPNAYADPTHIRYFNLGSVRYFCCPHESTPEFWPLLASTDGASIFADLIPVKAERSRASAEHLARIFG